MYKLTLTEELAQAVPNLDCFIDSEDVRNIGIFCEHLGEYAIRKADAMKLRLEGHIEQALVQENICDGIYRKYLKGKVSW